MIQLDSDQIDAIREMHNGCILCGDTGSGKSRTALAYFYLLFGGKLFPKITRMENPIDLYIITIAKKRDKGEWEEELEPFGIDEKYGIKITIDSWNNINKYKNVKRAFFIFDEQRAVGSGVWANSFIRIAKNNQWIMLSATPGDAWKDYVPVFIANGFYKNRTEFNQEHCIFSRFTKFPMIERYLGEVKLRRLRDSILVNMNTKRKTIQHHMDISVTYDRMAYRTLTKDRWNIFTNKPVQNISELCFLWRKIVNTDPSRAEEVLRILKEHPRVIIFYNYNYELDILKSLPYPPTMEIAEWNGNLHEPIPFSDSWVYLVQYTAGAEGWNCTETDTIIFYSQNYSYKVVHQSSGRIDRRNTPYTDLYYYHLKSTAPIDLAISRALKNKKKFNESRYVKKF